jgi:hypothetical protein
VNAGFSNLDLLKKRLLAGSMQSGTQFNDVILAIGLGMAGLIEQFCQRTFAYQAGFVETFGADRVQFLLSRTPLIAVTLSEFKQDEPTGWVTQDSDYIRAIDIDNGVIYLDGHADPGLYFSQVRFTYSGGYFWESAEPDDAGFPTTVPAGVCVLPAEVVLAWMLQCEQVWAKRDKLGIGLVDKPDEQSKIDELKLIPLVKQLLTNFVKLNLT